MAALEQPGRRVIANKAGGAGHQDPHCALAFPARRLKPRQQSHRHRPLSIGVPASQRRAVDAPRPARYRAAKHPLFIALFDQSWARARLKDQDMANTKSAKKAARQTVRRTEMNKGRRSRFRSSVRKVEEAIASGNQEAARAALKEAEPILVRTAQKGVLHRKTASRKVSRLAKRVGAMASP